jgi:hypothetical protein
MTFQQKFLIVVLLSTAAAFALAMALSSPTGPTGEPKTPRAMRGFGVPLSLAATMVALLVVGVVSHTFVRHVIQISPLVVALALGAYQPRLRTATALPLFTFWLFVMGGIWLFLLGIAPVFTGRFSPVEIVLTIVIGLASAAGIVSALREGTVLTVPRRLSAILLFAILQPIAMMLSF